MTSRSSPAKTRKSAEDAADYDYVATDVFTYGSVALALALAHETGLVHALCQTAVPASSDFLARKARLKERYVREVLNSLAVVGLVQLEPGTGSGSGNEARYLVPETHRKRLLHTAINCGYIAAGARRFTAVREILDVDGPSYSLTAEERIGIILLVGGGSQRHFLSLLRKFAHTALGIRHESTSFNIMEQACSMELDYILQAILETPGLRQSLENGIDAAEVGCGYGLLSRRLAAMFPRSRFTVTDAVPEPLELARQRADSHAVTNMTFQILDLCHVPGDCAGRFDWIWAHDVIHDLPYPVVALKGIHKALKPGGHFSLSDVFYSSYVARNLRRRHAAASYVMSTFFCLPESYQRPDSAALGPCWGEEVARDLVHAAGFHVLGQTKVSAVVPEAVLSASAEEELSRRAVCMCRKSYDEGNAC